MANVHHLFQAFNAGELSPLLGARFGVEKVASGCRRLRNFLLHVHGPAFRRPGMEYMGDTGSHALKSRLLPFTFSTTTGFILEFHPAGLRVWSNGLLVTLLNPVALPYSESECQSVQMVQINDVAYLTHPAHAVRKLIRYADDDWRISEPAWKWPAMGDPSAVTTDQAPVPELLLTSPTIAQGAEFSAFVAGSGAFALTMSIVGPDLSAATKTITIERRVSETWSVIATKTWTTASWPTYSAAALNKNVANNLRLKYDGPQAASGGRINVTWPTGSTFLATDTSILSRNEVTVPAGEWQATLVCPADVAGSAVYVERFNGSTWDILHTYALVNDATLTYRGPTLTAASRIRFRWTGTIMDTGGSATIEQLVFPPALDVTIAASATTGTSRTLTASAAIFLPGHVGSYWQISHRRDQPYVQIVGAEPTLSAATSPTLRVSGGWQVLTYGAWDSTLYLERLRGATWEVVRSWESNLDRNVAFDGDEETTADLRIRVAAGTAAAATGAAVPRFVLEATDSTTAGLVKIKSVGALTGNGKSLTATADIIVALQSTAATPLWEEGAWSDVRGYPRTVAVHGERLWFGGTAAEPMRVWGSVVADYEDFRRTTYDDASVSFTPAAMSSNPINWMLSREKELIIGTAGDEWTLGTDSGPITPVNVLVVRRSAYGSEYIQAMLLNEVVVFVQRGGRKMRNISPRADSEAWVANDLTVLAEHIARAGIVAISVMTAPFSILWAVTTDGKLLGMTFEQEQNVFGWHVHSTDGLVESVAVIRAADADEVWLTVLRDDVRFVERLDPLVLGREFDQRERLIYLDAAKRYAFSEPTSEITGLEHLECTAVGVCGDGAEQESRYVKDGAITLEVPATNVVIGLPYTSELQPMRMDLQLRDGTAQGREFRVSRVYLTVEDSLGGEIADYPERPRWEPINYRRVSSPMDEAPPLLSGEQETAIESNARAGIDVIVRTSSPLPLNIGSIVVKCDLYGE